MLMYECGLKGELEAFRHQQQLQVLFDHNYNFSDTCQVVNSTVRSYQWMSDEIKKIASEIPRPRVGVKRGTKTCIAIGMFSRVNEFDLRHWQRGVYNSYKTEWGGQVVSDDDNDGVQLHFFFAVSKVSDYNITIMDPMIDEQEEYGDILLLDVEEKYELLTAKTFGMLRSLHPLVNSQECKRGYIVKIDSDVVVGYEQLVKAIKQMPSRSVYFGQMIPNTPFTKNDRANNPGMPSSLSVLPLFANGPVYGVSRDVAGKLLSSDVQSIVWDPKTSFTFREEDRAVGLALHQGQVDVRHYLHIPHIFTFCSLDFSCEHYRHAMAISIGSGLSGNDQVLFTKKKNALALFYQNLVECKKIHGAHPPEQTLFFNVKGNRLFERRRMADVLVEGCLSVEPAVQGAIENFNKLASGSLDEWP